MKAEESLILNFSTRSKEREGIGSSEKCHHGNPHALLDSQNSPPNLAAHMEHSNNRSSQVGPSGGVIKILRRQDSNSSLADGPI